MTKLLALTSVLFFSFLAFSNDSKISLEKYIDTWKDVAINQMLTHGIPASITLSQGILESGFGNSALAVQANNHFGIKCHDWKGETFLKDDDKKNECFRKYDDAAQSYQDHSLFLTTRSRYSFLFELDITDYKSWAKGLKEAGYATNPQYPKRLIDIIERYELHQYDVLGANDYLADNQSQTQSEGNETVTPKETKVSKGKKTIKNGISAQKSESTKRKVYTNSNRTKYVIAGKHDTFYLIAKEYGFSLRQMNRWNDFPPNKDVLSEGDKVYIMRKRKRIDNAEVEQKIGQMNNLWELSQDLGVQLKSLLEFNTENKPNVAMTKAFSIE
ncbi:glucosaminidase domain-containing protein [Brumimicrobium oceani]|uniref:Peptidoglycan hydrolase n=1 Tax=Brumimicrobium oceani TaxID=2100725 RepID=A0A2U2XE83_9FLAO|nr:glucosaminidase domain-containing protein [Brumimicrobium oceani]PWH86083.1 hypothetical protein DIT68_05875 [Brumimicrobium oceani]